MKHEHYLTSYPKKAEELRSSNDERTAASLAVGGSFEAAGVVEFSLLKQEGMQPGDRVIDVGCGSGRLAYQLRDYLTSRYVGIDVVPELLDYARNLCARPDWDFYPATGTTIDEPDASADYVAFFSVFTHLLADETYRYLQETHRVLAPGGKVVFSFLEFADPTHWTVFEGTLAETGADRVLNQFMDRDMIAAFARHIGFTVERLDAGHVPTIALDRPVVWDDGRAQEGMGNLGQSICVLRKA